MLLRIYTKTGDEGDTSLACGSRIPKDDLRVEAYGTIDELSATLGVASAELCRLSEPPQPWAVALMEELDRIQEQLFTLASMIATSNLPSGTMPVVSQESIQDLEAAIDFMADELPELRNFILPGGTPAASYLHLARTVCRRAERVCITLDREQPLDDVLIPYLNRLSDYLFTAARWIAFSQGESDKIWLGRKSKPSQEPG